MSKNLIMNMSMKIQFFKFNKIFLFLIQLLSFNLTLLAFAGIEKPSKSNSITLESSVNYTNLLLSPLMGNSDSLDYSPNANGRYGLILNFWKLSVFFGSIQGETEQEKMRYGHTEFKDYRISSSLGSEEHWYLSAYSSNYLGLHIENSGQTSSSNSIPPVKMLIQRPNLKLVSNGAEITYVFSPQNFSLSGALFQTSIQNSVGGSFLISLSAESTELNDTESLIPNERLSDFSKEGSMTSGLFRSLFLNGGFGFTTVDKTSFITLIVLGGLGSQQQDYGTDEERTTNQTQAQKASAKLTIGQNNQKAFYGINGTIDQIIFQTNSIKFVQNLSTLKLFLGVRF